MSVSVCLSVCVCVCVCLSVIISSELHVRSSPQSKWPQVKIISKIWYEACNAPLSCVFAVSDEFNIYTREAGAGMLSVGIEGPSLAKIEMTDNPNGYTMVSYIVTKEGRSACTVEYTGCRGSQDFG